MDVRQRAGASRFFESKDLRQNLGRRTARGGALTMITIGINFVIVTVSTVLVTRWLTADDFGLYGMVLVLVALTRYMVDLGLSRAVIQIPEINHPQVSTLFWINFAIGIALSLLIAAMTPLMVWFYDEPRVGPINLAMSPLLFLSALTQQHRALLARRLEFSRLNVINIVTTLISAVTGLVVAIAGGGVWALIAMPISKQATEAAGCWIACPWIPGRPQRRTGVRRLVSFGVNFTGFQFITILSRHADNVMLGYTWGAGPLGLYTRAYSLMMLPVSRLNRPLTNVIVPALSRLADQPDRYRRAYRQTFTLMATITTPPVALLLLVASELVPLALGQQWAGTVPIFLALGPAALMATTSTATQWMYLSLGHVDRQLRWSLIHSALLLPAMLIGVQYGAMGMAIAVSSIQLAMKLPEFQYACRGTDLSLRDFLVSVGFVYVACLAAIALSVGVSSQFEMSQLATLGLKTLTFAAALAVGYVGTPQGRGQLKIMLDSVKSIRSGRKPSTSL